MVTLLLVLAALLFLAAFLGRNKAQVSSVPARSSSESRLLTICSGDSGKVARLIDYEIKREPGLPRLRVLDAMQVNRVVHPEINAQNFQWWHAQLLPKIFLADWQFLPPHASHRRAG